MRILSHISPTSLNLFYKNREEFYLNYISDKRLPRLPQTQPMSVGSAFDSYVKSFMYNKLIGKDNPIYDFDNLFTAQVESHNRDFALKAGKHCFDEYIKCGALADLMLDIERGIGKPQFELDIKGVVNGYREGITKETAEGVIFLGKPDLFYLNKEGAQVILDWKVNGYCSNWHISPMPGYVKLREGKLNKGAHKDAIIMPHNGVMINHATTLDQENEDWAAQLSIYSWLLGIEVGSYDFITAIDQLVCNKEKQTIRIAEHRLRVRSVFQWDIFKKAQDCWEICNSNWIFRDMTEEQSLERQKFLDGLSEQTLTDNEKWFFDACRWR